MRTYWKAMLGVAAVLAVVGLLATAVTNKIENDPVFMTQEQLKAHEIALLAKEIAATPKQKAVVVFYNPVDPLTIRYRDDVRRLHKAYADKVDLIEIDANKRWWLAFALYGAKTQWNTPYIAVLSSRSGDFFTAHSGGMPFPDKTKWTDKEIIDIIELGLR